MFKHLMYGAVTAAAFAFCCWLGANFDTLNRIASALEKIARK